MIKKVLIALQGFFRLSPRGGLLAVLLVGMLIVGYPAVSGAFSSPGGGGQGPVMPSICGPCPPPTTTCVCAPVGTTYYYANELLGRLYEYLQTSSTALQAYIQELTMLMVLELQTRIGMVEINLVSWWKDMWSKGLLPAMQGQTQQLGTTTALQSHESQVMLDAAQLADTQVAEQQSALEAQNTFRISTNVCESATIVGGFGRTAQLAQRMRWAYENKFNAVSTNKKTVPGVSSAASAERKRYEEYRNLFCNPDSNGGKNDCGSSDAAFYDADTQPSKRIFNAMTIDVTDPKKQKMVEAIIENMVGIDPVDPIPAGALNSAAGQEEMLKRRAMLAKYAAVRSVPQLVTSWRLPGSKMGDWIKALREKAGVPLTGISDNPSYKEVFYAASVDRFNSGSYATKANADEAAVEMDKLTADVFYLMQLRDYYELLERTAMTLAVQVSMMTDQVPVNNAVSATPVR